MIFQQSTTRDREQQERSPAENYIRRLLCREADMLLRLHAVAQCQIDEGWLSHFGSPASIGRYRSVE